MVLFRDFYSGVILSSDWLLRSSTSIPGLRLLSVLDLLTFLALLRSLTFAQSKGWKLALDVVSGNVGLTHEA